MSIKGKVALITGGTGALGEAVVKAFLEAGWITVTTYLDQPAIDNLRLALGSWGDKVHAFKGDAGDSREMEEVVATVVSRFGKLDAAVCLVGGWAGGKSVADSPDELFHKMLDLNLRTTFTTCRAALGPMISQRQGAIVTVGSIAVLKGGGGSAIYTAAKSGVVSLTQSIADEGKPYGVRANVVLPTTIDTPANRRGMPDADFTSWVSPVGLAEVILFLAGERSREITGAVIPVTGRS